MFVKPAAGRKVRHPQTKLHIPAEGLEVPDGDPYWTRRLRSGDVVLVAPAALAKPTASKARE